jgi:hypothetical protein
MTGEGRDTDEGRGEGRKMKEEGRETDYWIGEERNLKGKEREGTGEEREGD